MDPKPPRRIEPVVGKWVVMGVIATIHIVHKRFEISEQASQVVIIALAGLWSATDTVALGQRIQTIKAKIFEKQQETKTPTEVEIK